MLVNVHICVHVRLFLFNMCIWFSLYVFLSVYVVYVHVVYVHVCLEDVYVFSVCLNAG